jgi:hypothetical protein
MKVNIATNAEFVSWMGSVATEKINTLSSLSQCASAIRTFPEQYDYHFLHATDKAKYDDAIEMEFTVKELKAILDPTHNLELISIIGDEHEEYFEMFYQPCMSAIYGLNIGNDNAIDLKNFIAAPWYNDAECQRVSCLEPNKAWDRTNRNGCMDGLLARQNITSPIPTTNDPYCAIVSDAVNGQETCKYTPDKALSQ